MSNDATQGPLRLSLFLLRVSLGLFLLIWSIEKLVKPEGTVRIFESFYRMDISPEIAFALGIPQVLLSLAIVLGLYKTVTYGLGLILHAISTISTYAQLLNPFERGNHLFLAAIPVLIAFIVIFLMRRDDTLWTVKPRK